MDGARSSQCDQPLRCWVWVMNHERRMYHSCVIPHQKLDFPIHSNLVVNTTPVYTTPSTLRHIFARPNFFLVPNSLFYTTNLLCLLLVLVVLLAYCLSHRFIQSNQASTIWDNRPNHIYMLKSIVWLFGLAFTSLIVWLIVNKLHPKVKQEYHSKHNWKYMHVLVLPVCIRSHGRLSFPY